MAIFNQSNLVAKIIQRAKVDASLNISNSTYGAAWADDTAIAPSKAAVYAKIQTVGGSFAGTMDDITDGATYVKTENNLTDALVSAIGSIPTVDDTAYDATTWDGNTDAPTKNAVRDKFESLSTGSVPTAWGKYF